MHAHMRAACGQRAGARFQAELECRGRSAARDDSCTAAEVLNNRGLP